MRQPAHEEELKERPGDIEPPIYAAPRICLRQSEERKERARKASALGSNPSLSARYFNKLLKYINLRQTEVQSTLSQSGPLMEKLLKLCMVVLSIVIGGSAQAADQPFAFRGISLGITKDEFRQIPYPDARPKDGSRVFCSKERGDLVGLDVSNRESRAGIIRCGFFYKIGGTFMPGRISVGKVDRVSEPLFVFHRNAEQEPFQLYLIMIKVPAESFAELLEAYEQRFGHPITLKQEEVQNKFGNVFKNRIATWKNSVSTIQLSERTSQVDQGEVMYFHNLIGISAAERLRAIDKSAPDRL
jgi:hypothetical protein